MNHVLQEILATGFADGKSIPLHSHISIMEGVVLQEIVKSIKPVVSLEVGLAFGVSCLFICEALPSGSRHIVIDPFQRAGWNSVGLANLRKAGYKIEFL